MAGQDKPENWTDLELVSRFRETGREEYFAVVWKRYAKSLEWNCARMLADRGQGQEVAQEAFIAALRHIDSFRDGSFGAWIGRIAKNLSINRLRSAARKREIAPNGGQPVEREAMAENHLQLVHEVAQVLSQMENEKHRLILKLIYFEGLSYQEISDRTGLSLDSIRSYAQNGRKAFAQIWNQTRQLQGKKASA